MSTTLRPGTDFANRFEVERLVERGGMGTIYRAIDRSSGERVALKLMDPGLDQVAQARTAERFLREARMLSLLRHPGIVEYIAHGHTGEGQLFLAMQWLEGEDLSRRLARGRLSLQTSMRLLERVTGALAFAHTRGIVHRDLKPSNLFLRDGRVEQAMLLDFGIARTQDAGSTVTKTGLLVGTPSYMAPEQARGARRVQPASDVFALGCVFYACLTGKSPFEADHPSAALAKVLFEDPLPVRKLRPLVPEAWEALLARMLDKDARKRPTSAVELATELLTLPQAPHIEEAATEELPVSAQVAWSRNEQQFVCVLMVDKSTLGAADVEADDEAATVRARELPTMVARHAVHVEWLADGVLVATVTLKSNAKDQAGIAARTALALREHWPDARISVATRRIVIGERGPTGEAIDRAARLLTRLNTSKGPPLDPRGILLDELTAGLLDPRFVLTPVDEGAILQEERASVDQSRPLLGKPTACVGRELELAQLEGLFLQCVEDSASRAALITAPPGAGKSRLRHEFLRRLRTRCPEAQILTGHGDPLSAGSPYGILSQALCAHAGLHPGETPAAQEAALREGLCRHVDPGERVRVSEFLGELCGVAFPDEHSPQLKTARSDPKAMSDHITRAFLDWLKAESAEAPVILVLEDLQWGDALTVKLMEAALSRLAEQPFLVLALARPELRELFPTLLTGSLLSIALRPLSKKASAQLVHSALAGRAVSPETIARIVEQAAGNALFLEELVRAAAEGKADAVPETVLAMLQARFLRLAPEARQLLRMVSVFGATFWAGALDHLFEPCSSAASAAAHWLPVLVDAEILEPHAESRFPGEVEYGFRHALVRDAAYDLLASADRKLAHRLVCLYLEQKGETDVMALAEHAYRGEDRERAVAFYLRAAEQSLERNDLTEASHRAARAVECGAKGEALGTARAFQSMASFGLARWRESDDTGLEALTLLPRGSGWWCKVADKLFNVLPTIGRMDRFQELVKTFSEVEPAPEARPDYVIATAHLMLVSAMMGAREEAYRCLDRIRRTGAHLLEDDARVGAWFNFEYSFSLRMMEADPYRPLTVSLESERAAARTGVMLNHCLPRWAVGMAQADLGDLSAGEATLRGSLEAAEHVRDPYCIANAQVYLGSILVERGDADHIDEAERLALAVLPANVSNAYSGLARMVLSSAHLLRGQAVKAEAEARRAIELLCVLPTFLLSAQTALLKALCHQGHAPEAAALAREGMSLLASLTTGGWSEVAFRVAAAEAFNAAGERDVALDALREALRQVELRASAIPDASLRERYLTGRPENRRASTLAREWLG